MIQQLLCHKAAGGRDSSNRLFFHVILRNEVLWSDCESEGIPAFGKMAGFWVLFLGKVFLRRAPLGWIGGKSDAKLLHFAVERGHAEPEDGLRLSLVKRDFL